MIESTPEKISHKGSGKVNSMSYVDLHQRISREIDAEMEAALEGLGSSPNVRNAVAALMRHQQLRHPLSVLPLLVHAVETGAFRPALPLSAVHVLWWTSACYLDDLADSQSALPAGDLGFDESVLAAVITGNALPMRVIQAQPLPHEVRGALTAELMDAWIAGTEGQLVDMGGDVRSATRDSVISIYRGKSGGPFGMITAMAAIWAKTSGERIDLWREFGYVFGIIWQLFNDQEDILSGRNEDLQNGTVTYLLACAIEDASPESRDRILTLHAASQNSERARSELTHLLLAPDALRRYHDDLDAFRIQAHRLLDELDGDELHTPVLRGLVDQSARMLLQADLAPAEAAS
ncbi:polyprenyl synthetase family protein [Streptomyces purpureus]|uniref:polyprenyl synthetase family protein n=1 Tax=Streptomyces purpureus TaxID=1951 RepID=UPI001FD593D9|nr:polyprenyl synthetase family protein [Streptomyces purpureus]